VPGTLRGYLGTAVFAGIKCVRYSLAVSGGKKLEPLIASTATKIAAVRTGWGVILGTLGDPSDCVSDQFFIRPDTSPNSPNWSLQTPGIYGTGSSGEDCFLLI
jgi:hypothetical protein